MRNRLPRRALAAGVRARCAACQSAEITNDRSVTDADARLATPACRRRGLLPPRVITLDKQEERFMRDYESGSDQLIAPEEVESGGVTREMARKWKLLNGLQDRNETLFYR